MKRIIIFSAMFLCTISTFGQSVSASKILNFLNSQNTTTIGADLKKVGFTFKGKSEFDGFTEFSYLKNGNYGLEKINIGYNDELFSVVYKTSPEAFNGYKAKLLTSDFQYTYSFKNSKYYENENMRIGINEVSNIISCFVKLK